jgi:hypothetical protein
MILADFQYFFSLLDLDILGGKLIISPHLLSPDRVYTIYYSYYLLFGLDLVHSFPSLALTENHS